MICRRASLLVLANLLLSGCAVREGPGTGLRFKLQEAQTGRKGYMYIPAGYDLSKRWPVVLTFHAYKPFGGAKRQIREWASTADKYGLIIVAPDLINCGPRMSFRLNRITSSVKEDEQAAMGMLDYVLKNTSADPERVFVTGFSSGGFLMHYITNQNPERFAALCSRGCSFNGNILDEDNARQMAAKGFPVMIYYTEYDTLNTKLDSRSAIRWYEKMGFEVESMVIPQKDRIPGLGLGHLEGRPWMAADFFLRSTGLAGKLRIVASIDGGSAPLGVNLAVELPHHVDAEGLRYLWMLDGQTLGRTAEVYTTIVEPGVHDIQVVITDRRGRTLSTSQEVTVRPSGT